MRSVGVKAVRSVAPAVCDGVEMMLVSKVWSISDARLAF